MAMTAGQRQNSSPSLCWKSRLSTRSSKLRSSLSQSASSCSLPSATSQFLDDIEEKGAMGFLSFVEKPVLSAPSPNSQFLKQFHCLKLFFPEFPSNMLKALLLRESGCGQIVYDILLSQGWNPRSLSALPRNFSSDSNAHFNVDYFWGKHDASYQKALKRAKPGSYLTSFTVTLRPTVDDSTSSRDNVSYQVWYVDSKQKVRQWLCNSPQISEDERKIFSLQHGLKRPSEIPLSALIAFDVE